MAATRTLTGGLVWLIAQVVLLWRFRAGAARIRSLNASLALCLLVIATTAWIARGIDAIQTPMALILPLVALAAGSVRAGLAWLLIVCLHWLSLGLAPLLGFEPISVQSPAAKAINASFFLSATAILSLSIMSIAHIANRALQRQLADHAAYHHHRAQHDELTQLPNRGGFIEVLEASIRRAELTELQFALVILDLNGFKAINDRLGHLTGDQVLAGFARQLRHSLRDIDTPGRLGGDEFAIILEGVKSQHDTKAVLEKLQLALQESIQTDKEPLRISVSIGVALFPSDADNLDALYDAADTAMYKSKREKIEVCFWQQAS